LKPKNEMAMSVTGTTPTASLCGQCADPYSGGRLPVRSRMAPANSRIACRPFVTELAGMCASVRAAKTLYGPCSLIILDFEAGPLHSGALDRLTSFSQFECRCRDGILAIVPEGFAAGGSFNGCRAIEIIDVHHTSLSPGQDMPAGGSWHAFLRGAIPRKNVSARTGTIFRGLVIRLGKAETSAVHVSNAL
jgi:hypothetical protein